MSETGVVKFTCEHVVVDLAPFEGFDAMNACRRKLLQSGLLGVGADGIGFGNLSIRAGATDAFYVTGSGTGGIAQLRLEHIAKVTAYNVERNWLRCEGRTLASSESLTHAALYARGKSVRAVIHGHSATLWQRLNQIAPTTAPAVEYGTPEMAREVQRLFETTDMSERRVFVMTGHENGVVAFGQTFDEALRVLERSTTRGPRASYLDFRF